MSVFQRKLYLLSSKKSHKIIENFIFDLKKMSINNTRVEKIYC